MTFKEKEKILNVLIGNKIKTARVCNGRSQKWLGQELGTSFQQVQKYENGLNSISAGKLKTIAELLEYPYAYFLNESAGQQDPANEKIIITKNYEKLICLINETKTQPTAKIKDFFMILRMIEKLLS